MEVECFHRTRVANEELVVVHHPQAPERSARREKESDEYAPDAFRAIKSY